MNGFKTVSFFAHYGSIVANDAKMKNEIGYRMGKSNSPFDNRYHKLWNSCDVSVNLKTELYKSVILISLFYGAKS